MQQDDKAGMLFALAGFTVLSGGDAVIKTMAGDWSPVAVAALRFSIGALGLSVLLWAKEGRSSFRPQSPRLQLARGACLALATLFFFSAIFVMPLAEAMAVALVAPVLTALLSRPLLGETIRPATWIACVIALAGAGLVLRPNLLELGLLALLPLASATFFSLMVIANRASAGQGSALAMQAYIALIAAPVLVLAAIGGKISGVPALDFGWPDWTVVARCTFVALTATTAHWLVYLGTMRAGASRVAPMTYVQLLTASFFGWALFDEVPDAAALTGGAIIIAAGLYLWRDGRILASTRER